MATAVAVIGLIIGAAGTAKSIREGRESERAQKKASKTRANEAAQRNARARRQQVAQARRARAATIAQGEAAGISGGSQVAGAVGSIQSQEASNISFSNQLESFDVAQSGFAGQVGTAQRRGSEAQAIGSTFSNIALKFA